MRAPPPHPSLAEVAFLDSPRSFADIFERFESVGWLFFVNRLVDLLFLADLVLQFRLMYTESSTTEGMRWVSEPVYPSRPRQPQL